MLCWTHLRPLVCARSICRPPVRACGPRLRPQGLQPDVASVASEGPLLYKHSLMNEAVRFADMMQRSAALKRRIAVELADAVVAVVGACETSLRGGGKLMFCGNGG